MVETLDLEELEKIVAHELAHIKHYHGIKRFLTTFLIDFLKNTIRKAGADRRVKEYFLGDIKHKYFEMGESKCVFPFWKPGDEFCFNIKGVYGTSSIT